MSVPSDHTAPLPIALPVPAFAGSPSELAEQGYPDNRGWSATLEAIEFPDGSVETHDLVLRFAHTDGRALEGVLVTFVGGEVLGPDGERLPGSEDGFASMVDEAFEGNAEVAERRRSYWIFDHSIQWSARPAGSEDDADWRFGTPEESQQFVHDITYTGPYAELAAEHMREVHVHIARVFTCTVMLFDDLDGIHRTVSALAPA